MQNKYIFIYKNFQNVYNNRIYYFYIHTGGNYEKKS